MQVTRKETHLNDMVHTKNYSTARVHGFSFCFQFLWILNSPAFIGVGDARNKTRVIIYPLIIAGTTGECCLGQSY